MTTTRLLPIFLLSCCLLGFLAEGCQKKQGLTGPQVLQKAIGAHGGQRYENSTTTFRFRQKQYRVTRQGGSYLYERRYTDSAGQRHRDVLRNDTFRHYVEGKPRELPPKAQRNHRAALNSVVYFAFLPYKLQDPAVKAELLGSDTLAGEAYHQVRVTFAEEGGGQDHEDVFLYWLGQDDFLLDYLAYRYHTNSGGVRFRKAVDQRQVGGIRFNDYLNYKPADPGRPLQTLGTDWQAGKLEKVSEIRLEEVEVGPAKLAD